jgi:hypothetical protein
LADGNGPAFSWARLVILPCVSLAPVRWVLHLKPFWPEVMVGSGCASGSLMTPGL